MHKIQAPRLTGGMTASGSKAPYASWRRSNMSSGNKDRGYDNVTEGINVTERIVTVFSPQFLTLRYLSQHYLMFTLPKLALTVVSAVNGQGVK